jgi:hypothetical protein
MFWTWNATWNSQAIYFPYYTKGIFHFLKKEKIYKNYGTGHVSSYELSPNRKLIHVQGDPTMRFGRTEDWVI